MEQLNKALYNSLNIEDCVFIDFETTLINEAQTVDLIWMVGYEAYLDGDWKYFYIKWDNGISPENLSSLLQNVRTLAAIHRKPQHVQLAHFLDCCSKFTPVFHNAQFDKKIMDSLNIPCPVYHDTMVMGYILFPPPTLGAVAEDNLKLYSLKQWGLRGFCDVKLDSPGFDKFTESMIEYNSIDVKATRQLASVFLPILNADKKSLKLYVECDMPATEYALNMTRNGVYFSDTVLDEYILESEKEMETLLRKIREQTGPVFDKSVVRFKKKQHHRQFIGVVPTSKDLNKLKYVGEEEGEYIYQEIVEFQPSKTYHIEQGLRKLGWTPTKYTDAGNPALDKTVIASSKLPLGDDILEYKKLEKIYNTYLLPWKKDRDKAGLIHPSFITVGTKTGRYSSRNPNFQNIPRNMRDYIKPRSKDNVLVCIDMSQAELRILAYYCATVLEELDYDIAFQLWNNYIKGEDIHSANSELMGVERIVAKTAMFLTIYGGGANRLAISLKCSKKQAKDYLNKLYEVVPALPMMQDAVKQAIECTPNNTLRTLYGRKIYYPDYFSSDSYIQSKAFRQYFNMLIQGTNADIIKVLAWESMKACRLTGAFPIVQVHDELVFECPKSNSGQFMDRLFNIFNRDDILSGLPLVGIPGQGESWAEAKRDGDINENKLKAMVDKE